MKPGCVSAGEFTKESSSCAGSAALGAAAVVQVSGLERLGHLIVEVLPEGHAPHAITGHCARLSEHLPELVAAGEDTSGSGTKGHSYGASQGGNVHCKLGLELGCVGQSVGQNQTTLRVCVVHDYRLAVHRCDYVPRLGR